MLFLTIVDLFNEIGVGLSITLSICKYFTKIDLPESITIDPVIYIVIRYLMRIAPDIDV